MKIEQFLKIYGSSIINILLGVFNLAMYFWTKRPLSLFAAGFILGMGLYGAASQKLYYQMREHIDKLSSILNNYQEYILKLQELIEGVVDGNIKVSRKQKEERKHLTN